ncbi:MAG: asparaginase [Proteobacteria bacterium]|nr:asparaginase [Pseudomonadota bacterium]
MANPVLVDVTRGNRVESCHRGAIAVFDAYGRSVFSAGNVEEAIYPRSAVKAIQALPLIESGAADAFGYGNRELTLAQASHGGEPGHVATAAAMLKAAGLDESALECGTQWPTHSASATALSAAGDKPSALHNNCSGKHAGLLAVARHCGFPIEGYVKPDHPAQRLVRDALASLTGAAHAADDCGIDGCSIPTYAVPLTALATGFARFGNGQGLVPERAAAARRIFDAAIAEPFYFAGTGRFCTEAITATKGDALVKTGAEGVFCGTVPNAGLGIAIKCDDGASRAAETLMANLLLALVRPGDATLKHWANPPLLNRRGIRIGEIRLAEGALAGLGVERT